MLKTQLVFCVGAGVIVWCFCSFVVVVVAVVVVVVVVVAIVIATVVILNANLQNMETK